MSVSSLFSDYKTGVISTSELTEKITSVSANLESFPLSEGQKALWALQQTYPSMSAYNCPVCLLLRNLDIEALRNALLQVSRHQSLLAARITYAEQGPVFEPDSIDDLLIEEMDWSDVLERDLRSLLYEQVKKPFDFAQGPLWRIQLFRRNPDTHLLLLTFHHIIFDGVSQTNFLENLFCAYEALVNDATECLPTNTLSFQDFMLWEQDFIRSSEAEAELAYWREQLSGELPLLTITPDRTGSSPRGTGGEIFQHRLSAEQSKRIELALQDNQVSGAVYFLAVFKLLLHKYTGESDIAIGMPVMRRPKPEFDGLIGCFINMLALRSQLDTTATFSSFIKDLQYTMMDGLDHGNYPFSRLVRELNFSSRNDTPPVFQVMYAYHNYSDSDGLDQLKKQYPSLSGAEILENISQLSEYALTLEVYEKSGCYELFLKYDASLYGEASVKALLSHYLSLLESVVKQAELSLASYSLLNESDLKKIRDWNDTKISYPVDKCLHDLIEDQAQQSPQASALVYAGESWSYGELEQRVCKLAIYLQNHGVGPGVRVAVCLERSLNLVLALLGVLKAGGAYVPLDPSYPRSRLEYMLEDSDALLMLTSSTIVSSQDKHLTDLSVTINLDSDWQKIESASGSLKQDVRSNDLAYVIYTSGSTGKPKGVMVEHRQLVNFLLAMKSELEIESTDSLFAVTTISFDIAALELYLPLLVGACCHIGSAETLKNISRLREEIETLQPTVMQATPSLWRMLLQSGWSNGHRMKLLSGGESLPEDLRQLLLATGNEVWNLYGPTETTVWSTVWRVVNEGPVVIGRPIANTQVYILDDEQEHVAIGHEGEIVIGGAGVVRGYWNQEALTEQRFITSASVSNERLYKTGDRGRWRSDGLLECLGRIDTQVKVRGHRIELAEIENQLLSHEKVLGCAVTVREQSGSTQLLAYYVAEDTLLDSELKTHLSLYLPDYMLPSLFISVDELPLLPNGKLDRATLSSLSLNTPSLIVDESADETEIEGQVLRIWEAILGIDGIDMDVGFFDVGGDSVLAVMVAHQVEKFYSCDFAVTHLFEYSSIRRVSRYIAGQLGTIVLEEAVSAAPINPPTRQGDFKETIKGTYPAYYHESIAVIGLSCHVPGAKDVATFWDNLRSGIESIRRLDEVELLEQGIDNKLLNDPDYVPVQSTIEGQDLFDPAFFDISPRDAEVMDPQCRLLLMHAWKAVEDAGYIPSDITNSAVFMSASNSFYQASNITTAPESYVSWLLSQSGSIPTLISHKLGLTGTSYFIQSNCSSSLVGLQAAYQNLLMGESRFALVGAATLSSKVNAGYKYQAGLNLSSDGHVKAFDAAADGMVAGEGAAVVMLKRALEAIEDGDHIYGLIRGVAVNNDGAEKVGFYAPSVTGQSSVLRQVLSKTGVAADSIGYVEAHGTGTKLGDPIEFRALKEVYGDGTSKLGFCGLGSVKSNIGHLDTAAGLVGLIKTLLSLYHKELVPSINYERPNPELHLEKSPFYIVDSLRDWTVEQGPRRAGLSSLGVGGTNAHAILEEYAPIVGSHVNQDHSPYVFVLSARDEQRLNEYAKRMLNYVQKQRDLDMSSLAYTLQIGRKAMQVRLAFIVKNVDDLLEKLNLYIDGKPLIKDMYSGQVQKSKRGLHIFEDDKGFANMLEQWSLDRKLGKLLALWVEGYTFDWRLLHKNRKPQRISLPTYPFAEHSYWLSTLTGNVQSATQKESNLPEQSGQTFGSEIVDEKRIIADPRPSSAESQLVKAIDINVGIPIENIQDELSKSLADILFMEVDEVDIDKPFIEMGLDSIVGVEWVQKINKQYATNVTTTKVYDYPTITDFSEFLFGQLKQEVAHPTSIKVDSYSETPVIKKPAADKTSESKTDLVSSASVSEESIENWLSESFAGVLFMEVDEVDFDKTFVEMGLDSIVGVEWIQKINKQYSTEVATTKIYDYPTIREFSKFLSAEINSITTTVETPQENIVETNTSAQDSSHTSKLNLRTDVAELISSPQAKSPGTFSLTPLDKIEEDTEVNIFSNTGDSYGLVLSNVQDIGNIELQAWSLTAPAAYEVMIAVKASAINFPDTMCVQGLYPTMPDYPFVPGFEVAGVVLAVGDKVSRCKPGDEVVALTGTRLGGHASRVIVEQDSVVRKPHNMTFEQACSLPVVFVTVYSAFNKAQLEKGEHVLIQTATGGCGLIALQLAQLKDCVCYATSSKEEKRDLLEKLQVPYVLDYQTAFDEEIQRLTQGRGVDVVLNMLAGDGIQRGLNSLASSGRYLELAVHALKTSSKLDLSKLVDNQSIFSIDLRRLEAAGRFSLKEILDLMLHMAEAGEITPITTRIYPISQIREAFKYVSAGQHVGKVVISHTAENFVDTTQQCVDELIRHKRKYREGLPDNKVTTEISRKGEQPAFNEGIAIIGVAGRFPKSSDVKNYWLNLSAGNDCISTIPVNRWSLEQYYDPDPAAVDKTDCKWMGVLEDVDKFDPLFFGISPTESRLMDPQQRLFLENCWHCLEDAGIDPAAISGTQCGVFVGCAPGDYASSLEQEHGFSAQGLMGSSSSILSARISYFLNLKGPNLAIDTACSASLVAIAEACNSLVLGASDMALAGGVCVLAGPAMHIMTSNAGMLSKDGRCFSFDHKANGFVPGEGVGVVLLKRLSDAKRDNDPVHAVIRGWGVNQDGKTNGITAPSVISQVRLEKEVYQRFGINPETITLVEAHGTGTELGDPIEVEALTESFRSFTKKQAYCALGSVKSNIGHLLTAAGVSGVVKVLLSMKHKAIPPTVHFEELNSHIRMDDSPFYINSKLRAWDVPQDMLRRAAVSSFGFSGTNAHVVLEEYPQENLRHKNQADAPYMIVLSARNEDRLKESVVRLETYLRQNEADLINVAYTLQVGRAVMSERFALLVETYDELLEKLSAYIKDETNIEGLYRASLKPGKKANAIFSSDKNPANKVDNWLEKGDFHSLLNAWVKGLEFDWHRISYREKPRRIRLPVYPFLKKSYWLSQKEKEQAHATGSAAQSATSVSDKNQFELIRTSKIFTKQWKLTPRLDAELTQDFSETDEPILILASAETNALAELVSCAIENSRIVDVCSLENVSGNAGQQRYRGLIDLIGCGESEKAELSSWLIWLQTILKANQDSKLKLLCVSSCLESYQDESVNLSAASRVGLYRMLGAEYKRLSSRHVDFARISSDEELAKHIVKEYALEDDNVGVCYRNGERYSAYLSAKEDVASDVDKPIIFPETGVLWITGGTRGLGLLCANHFVKNYGVRRLLLTGRQPLPPRSDWLDYEDQTGPVSNKIKAVKKLESLGVEVEVACLDLTDIDAVSSMLESTQLRWEKITGVLHCAGVADNENPAFVHKNLEDMDAVLSPKTAGLDTILSVIEPESLRFFVLFSSVSALLPSLAVGQADYALANSYMDYVAAAKHKEMPIISLQWPSWAETGMGVVRNTVYEQTGLLTLTDAEGLRLLDNALTDMTAPVLMPAVINAAQWQTDDLLKVKQQTRQASAAQIKISPDDETTLFDGRSWLTLEFAEVLGLGIEELDVDTPFPDYGVDSILLTQVLRRLDKKLGVTLAPTILYEYPTLSALENYLSNELGLFDKADPTAAPIPSLPGTASIEIKDGSMGAGREAIPEPIAVVGMSCRFPGAEDLEAYWQLLSEGSSALGPIPKERWGYQSDYYAGLLSDVNHFDPEYFLLAMEDVSAMDPQALLVMEESLKLFHQAGYKPDELKGQPVGVYLGARGQIVTSEEQILRARNPVVAAGQNYLSANVSHYFDLRGPSVVVDTACSSALVALNMASQALLNGDIRSALVGGVSVLASDAAHTLFERRGLLNPEPVFHAFDQRAGGVMPAEGIGMVLLKTLQQALDDGDRIYAVVENVSVNNDGRTAGPATPNLETQQQVMETALKRSGRQASELSYIEANASGSEVTDLLELKAIESVYRNGISEKCGLGSVKPNIGHPFCAEGIAGFIKLVLMLHKGQLVPFLSGQQPMPHYNLNASPFYFPRELCDWGAGMHVAGLNSFADGGTNAHVIMSSWQPSKNEQSVRQPLSPPSLNRVDIRSSKVSKLPLSKNSLQQGSVVAKERLESEQQESGVKNVEGTEKSHIWKQNLVEM